jgi:hypothetical protein
MKQIRPDIDEKLWTESEDYTHVILLNTCMPTITVPRSRVLGLAFEPRPYLHLTSVFIEYAKQFIGKYFLGDATGLPAPFVSFFSFMWHTSPPMLPLKPKTSIVSIMISNKLCSPGNQYRHSLANAILQTNLPIDIWGNGCTLLQQQDARIRGSFDDAEPYELYMFHVAIENYQSGHYMSEKIINPLLYECTPVYWGSPYI